MTEATQSDDSSISGYLYKRSRDERWQKRWFETNGVYLTYYKSRKTEKLLAALSLPQVGEIRIINADEDPEKLEGLFCLELNTRIYTLRAKTNAEAELWVRMLSKLRIDGIQASSNPVMTGVPSSASVTSEASGTTNNPGSSNNNTAGKSEWMRTGTSCLCC